MIVPKENIWQELRRDCLGTIPPDSQITYSKPVSLSVWQKEGYYSVTSISKRRYTLITASADIGGALLGDVEHLLDSAAEHQASLWKHINTSEWLSPAWIVVTFYYWAFFLVLALTRMLGMSAWFLDKDVTRMFLKLSSSKTGSPGSGCFRFSCGPQVGVTEREVLLDKTGSRIHDEIWKLWFSLCQDKLQRLGTGSSNSLEERLFACMVRTRQNLGGEWPSSFRNVVNYRPGFAYSAVRRVRVLESFRHLGTRPIDDTASLVPCLRSSLAVK